MEPATATLIASAIGSIAGAFGKKKPKYNAKAAQKETYADIINSAFNRNAELEAHRAARGSRTGQRRARSMMDTSQNVKDALSI